MIYSCKALILSHVLYLCDLDIESCFIFLQMRFLDGGTKTCSRSLLDVGVANAINHSQFDEQMFFKRGGKYVWSKGDMRLDW